MFWKELRKKKPNVSRPQELKLDIVTVPVTLLLFCPHLIFIFLVNITSELLGFKSENL